MTTAISSAVAPAFSVMLVQGPGAHYMLYVAGGCTVLAFVIALFQRTSASPKRGEGGESADVLGDLGDPDVPSVRSVSDAPSASDRPKTSVSTVFEKRAALPSFLILLMNVGFGSITTFIALHGQEQGVDRVSAYFVVYAVVTLASRPAIGRLIDRYGFRMPAILSCLCTVATLALIGLSRNMFMLAVAGGLAGVGIGTAMGVFQTMAVAAVAPWRRGVATSTYMVSFDVGIAIGSLVGGAIAQVFGYTVMYICIAAAPLAAAITSAATIPHRS